MKPTSLTLVIVPVLLAACSTSQPSVRTASSLEKEPVKVPVKEFVRAPKKERINTPVPAKVEPSVSETAVNKQVKPLDPLVAAQQMFAAAVSGDVQKGVALLESNPEVINATAGNAYGSTPLHFAAYNGRTEFAAWLLAHGATISAVNRFGTTPLHDAASRGHKDILDMILAKSPQVNLKDGKGKTSLKYALENGHAEVADRLRKNGAQEP